MQLKFRCLLTARSVGLSMIKSVKLLRTPRRDARKCMMKNAILSQNYSVSMFLEPCMKPFMRRIAQFFMMMNATLDLRRFASQSMRKSVQVVQLQNVRLSKSRIVNLSKTKFAIMFFPENVVSLRKKNARKFQGKNAR